MEGRGGEERGREGRIGSTEVCTKSPGQEGFLSEKESYNSGT